MLKKKRREGGLSSRTSGRRRKVSETKARALRGRGKKWGLSMMSGERKGFPYLWRGTLLTG